jgi:precorrin-2/cobalt-factor-2 C20-methyltransferase
VTAVTIGKLIGVGTGPGDPDLLTVKAVKAIQSADVLAWFAKEGRRGNGRGIVDGLVPDTTIELPLYYPVTTEIHRAKPEYIDQVTSFYEASTAAIAEHLAAGRTVALAEAGRINEAFYVERGTMANTAMTPLAEKDDDEAPYFSIVLVPGWKGKP